MTSTWCPLTRASYSDRRGDTWRTVWLAVAKCHSVRHKVLWVEPIIKTKDGQILTRRRWNHLKRRCRPSGPWRHTEEHAAWTPDASLSAVKRHSGTFWGKWFQTNHLGRVHSGLHEVLKVKTPVCAPDGTHCATPSGESSIRTPAQGAAEAGAGDSWAEGECSAFPRAGLLAERT